jgi:hypothetical protein
VSVVAGRVHYAACDIAGGSTTVACAAAFPTDPKMEANPDPALWRELAGSNQELLDRYLREPRTTTKDSVTCEDCKLWLENPNRWSTE